MESHKPGAVGPLQHKDYTVGWVCALPKEQTAATAMLDERHMDREQHLRKQPNDTNTYTLGSIGGHNIVIACLPKGRFGTVSAATVATNMVNTFPGIRFGLMVGIGGAVSRKVRLGDVVVSTPSGTHPGVVQWDMGKAGDRFERTGSLNNPPTVLLTALTKLGTENDMDGSKVPKLLKAVGDRNSRLRSKYEKSYLVDKLFKASYTHTSEPHETEEDEVEDEDEQDHCRHCDLDQTVKRKPREMMVHYGAIASGNRVIKNAQVRDQLSKDLGGNILCVEMEAAGLMDSFPCIVVRGICDYADSHKNDAWQEHAAAVAAAFAKELLGHIQASDVEGERTVQETLHTVCKDISAIKDDTAYTRTMLSSKADLDVLDWLTPTNYGPQHSDYLRRRQPGTGQWFLESEEYQQWLSRPGQTLFCHGMPGAGKTILSAIIIDNLEHRLRDDALATVIYVYLNFKRKDEQSVESLKLSLLKQLARARPSLPDAVRRLHRKHTERHTRPMPSEIDDTLHCIMGEYSGVFLVIDAIDEYQTTAGARGQFLSMLSDLQDKTCMNLLTTAREIPDIWDHFKNKGSPQIEVRASEDDIRTYINSQISQLDSFVAKRDALKDLIAGKIARSVKGMFLLAQLHVESLRDKDTAAAVRQALEEISASSHSAESAYDRAYGDTMTRITGQLANHAQRATQVLGWIIHAERPLTKLELQHALGVEFGRRKMDPENLPETSHLVSVCAGLVTTDEESGIIRLVHYTAQEYFVSTKEHWFPGFQGTILATCISYLSFEEFATRPCHDHDELSQRLKKHPFYDYAATHWGHHARGYQTCSTVLQFLRKKNEVETAMQARSLAALGALGGFHSTGLHMAAGFGLEKTVRELLSVYDVNVRDTEDTTALGLAAAINCLAAVRVLVEKGADLDSQETALCEASSRGHLDVVRYLIESNSPAQFDPETMRESLFHAAIGSFWETCDFLVEQGADINSKVMERSLLHAAVGSQHDGRDKAAEYLIEKGANLNAVDGLGETPLHIAMETWERRTNLVKLLIKQGADVNTEDKRGITPMDKAIGKGDTTLVDILTKSGAGRV